MSYKDELINLIEPNFIFSKKPINRFKINKTNLKKDNLDKIEQINELKKRINSIQNCNLKKNSKNLILGDGEINSSIIIVGEAPGVDEEKNNKTFQGEVGALLEKMLLAINIKRENIYSCYSIK
jgi:Uracil-DNA glycosylase